MRQPDFGDHAAEIRVRIVERFHQVHHAPVVQAEAGEILEGLNRREAIHQAVILLANPEHERIFFAGCA